MSRYYFFFVFIIVFVNKQPALSQTLEHYIEIAKQNNAQLKINHYDLLIATEKAKEVNTFENSQFEAGIPIFPRETYWGREVFAIKATQKLPWFGELKSKKALEEERAALKTNDLLLSEKELIYQLKQLYYTLYEQRASRELLKDTKELLDRYEDMATSAMENDLFSMNNVLKIRIQKNEIHSKAFQLYNDIEASNKNFNRLLEQDENTILNIPNTLNVLDILIDRPHIENMPLLQNLEQQQAIYQAEAALVDIAAKPSITVGIEYISVNKNTDTAIGKNGRDILIPQIGVEIPISAARYKSQKQQLQLQQEQLTYKIAEQKKQLNISIENENLHYNNALIQVVAAQNNILETQRIIDLYIKNFETAPLDYMKILQLELQKLHYQLLEIEATKRAFVAKARLDYLSE